MSIYEIRTYTLKPGTVAQFEKNFEVALPGRIKVSPLAAFWHTEMGPLNQVIHVWEYENLQHRSDVRAEAAKVPGWPPASGDAIVNMESEIWTPAPFSPALGGGKKLGNIYEMRIYQYQPGAIAKVLEVWEKSLPERVKLSPIAACMSSEVGGLNRWIHIWPYADLAERHRIREQSMKLPGWPPPTREWVVSQQTKMLIPASFSPSA
ncbi:MAG: NIPSNAP family protein [Candidatus Tectomicrobia bacterium]|uniref:NIPSNAP family protein n=1 Tax=Tectimicrobiota bacterium TaxID=2528274 RepID=A0A937VZN7_UNCTE|nr:NIPSNAP family protein [Candidatus Tectomicrobia bacterium]